MTNAKLAQLITLAQGLSAVVRQPLLLDGEGKFVRIDTSGAAVPVEASTVLAVLTTYRKQAEALNELLADEQPRKAPQPKKGD